jgi:exodeoxyribonuclease III
MRKKTPTKKLLFIYSLPADSDLLPKFVSDNKDQMIEHVVDMIEYAINNNMAHIEIFRFDGTNFVVVVNKDEFVDNLKNVRDYYMSMELYERCTRLKKLEKKGVKNIVFCGDINVAHDEIDIARPKENEKDVGFLPEERMWLDEVVDAGFIDTFRTAHPNKVTYSWWDMKTRARERNVGWRIDYFFVSKNLKNKIKKAEIFDEVLGSDHAPIFLEI